MQSGDGLGVGTGVGASSCTTPPTAVNDVSNPSSSASFTHPLCEPPSEPITSAQLASPPPASSSVNDMNSRSYVPSGRQTYCVSVPPSLSVPVKTAIPSASTTRYVAPSQPSAALSSRWIL